MTSARRPTTTAATGPTQDGGWLLAKRPARWGTAIALAAAAALAWMGQDGGPFTPDAAIALSSLGLLLAWRRARVGWPRTTSAALRLIGWPMALLCAATALVLLVPPLFPSLAVDQALWTPITLALAACQFAAGAWAVRDAHARRTTPDSPDAARLGTDPTSATPSHNGGAGQGQRRAARRARKQRETARRAQQGTGTPPSSDGGA